MRQALSMFVFFLPLIIAIFHPIFLSKRISARGPRLIAIGQAKSDRHDASFSLPTCVPASASEELWRYKNCNLYLHSSPFCSNMCFWKRMISATKKASRFQRRICHGDNDTIGVLG